MYRVGGDESIPVDESEAPAGGLATQAAQLPSGAPGRVPSTLEAPGRPALTFAFHDNATVPSGLVRKILVRDVGLAEDEARKLL
jgi:hypothetical protein